MKTVNTVLGLLACFALVGCVQRQAVRKLKPFEVVELESCLAITIDMSGSFSTSWEGRAHQLFMQLLDAHFSAGAGAEARVVIGQISGADEVVLFEGQPRELRQKFKTPESLNDFLLEHAETSSSRVYESTRKMVDYVGSINGVTDETRLITVVLSDMADNTQDPDERESLQLQLVESLKQYQQRGGGLALYYVARDQAGHWNQILRDSGFGAGEFVIETVLSESPQLPRLN